MRVLGIETSCDETGVAIFDSNHGLVAHALHSQANIHAEYGGVVPELASRNHIQHIIPLLQKMKVNKNSIDAIAYTKGPGLVGALLVGASFAKTLGYAWKIPTIGINHIEGHVMSVFLEKNNPIYPFIVLLVSGGHTQLIKAENFGQYTILGETLDDAAGEAFDKTAKLLGMQYPGGPSLVKLAQRGIPNQCKFSTPMLDRPGLDFSFSGLKTEALYTILNKKFLSIQDKANIAYAFEEAIVNTLIKKCLRAIKLTDLYQLAVVGGVSANKRLRANLLLLDSDVKTYFPRLQFCTDNGAMIAYAGYKRLMLGFKDKDLEIDVKPRWILK